MGFRIVPSDEAFSLTPSKAKAVKRPGYLTFIRRLPCIITLRNVVEAAHLSAPSPEFGAYGRGKSQKADDSWALPLCREKHDEQHKVAEMTFWHKHGINPHMACTVLWGLYNRDTPDNAVEQAKRLIMSRSLGHMQ